MVNLYAFRATDPGALWRADDPIGPENDDYLAEVVARAELVVAAWGARAPRARVAKLADVLGRSRLHALAVTRDGAPRHPLYVSAATRPAPYSLSSATRSCAGTR